MARPTFAIELPDVTGCPGPKSYPTLEKPWEVGSFCLDNAKTYTEDKSKLRTYNAPANPKNMKFDLHTSTHSRDCRNVNCTPGAGGWRDCAGADWGEAEFSYKRQVSWQSDTSIGGEQRGRDPFLLWAKLHRKEISPDNSEEDKETSRRGSYGRRASLGPSVSRRGSNPSTGPSISRRASAGSILSRSISEEERRKNRVRYSEVLWNKKNTKHRERRMSTKQILILRNPSLSQSRNIQFFTWYEEFAKILTAPYTHKKWSIAVSLHNGTIYMHGMRNQQTMKRWFAWQAGMRGHNWGYHFEDYMSKGDSNYSYYSVVRSQILKHSLLTASRIHCSVDPENKSAPAGYLAFRIWKGQCRGSHDTEFMRHLLQSWARFFLTGVPEVVYGLRNKSGNVRYLKRYQTLDLPYIYEDQGWDPVVCLNFFTDVLDFLKEHVVTDDPNVVYVLTFQEPFTYIGMERFDDGTMRFLPDWYTN